MYESLPTPAVVVELNAVENNIRSMLEGAARCRIAHRPHVKSHRSVQLAKMQLALGAKGITCAKLGEAEVMADAGIDDILIAYPLIGEEKWERYARLFERCRVLRTMINSVYGAKGLSDTAKRYGRVFEVLVELDGGTRRGGLLPGEAALQFSESVRKYDGIKIVGLLYYPGRSYHEETLEGIERVARQERDELIGTARLLKNAGFDCSILSGGNTVTGKVPECLTGITEIRSGNYIFNDCAQLWKNRFTEEDCALRIVSTVIAKPDAANAILDCGTKTMSGDNLTPEHPRFGFIIGHPDAIIWNLNEEHGFVRSREGALDLEVGDRVVIIPNHACVVPNLAGALYGMRGGEFSEMIRVDAQSRSD
jgi:D-serine deaminase-like pyridoxal phosphate-dependent protein